MKNLTALERSVINTILFSVEHCWDKDDDGDYYSTDDFVCSLTKREHEILMELADKGI